MAVMERLKMFVVQEPVVAASCLIAGFGQMLYSFESSKQVPPPAPTDVVTGVTGKNKGNFPVRFSH